MPPANTSRLTTALLIILGAVILLVGLGLPRCARRIVILRARGSGSGRQWRVSGAAAFAGRTDVSAVAVVAHSDG